MMWCWPAEVHCRCCCRLLQQYHLLLGVVRYAGAVLPSSLWAFLRRRCILESTCDSQSQGRQWNGRGGGNTGGGCCVGVDIVSTGRGEMKGRKRTTIFIAVRSRNALIGPPTSWVPPSVSLSPNSTWSENDLPTALWKGEGRVRLEFVCLRWVGVLMTGPTSLKRGEGLLARLSRVIESEGGWRGRRWWWWAGGRTNINRDGVDVGFKLHSPSKIALDIGVHWFDKTIKIRIILEVL
jgi:hypothetical protein